MTNKRWVHIISNVDPISRTGDCAGCGRGVSLYYSKSVSLWVCRAKRNETQRNYHPTPEQRRSYRLKFNFKITPEQWDEMFEAQGRCCAICKVVDPTTERGWSLDHDHSCCPGRPACGKCNRGILCNPCNAAIGLFKEDPETLRSAIAYLEGI